MIVNVLLHTVLLSFLDSYYVHDTNNDKWFYCVVSDIFIIVSLDAKINTNESFAFCDSFIGNTSSG